MTASGVRVSTLNSSGTPPVPRPPAPPSRTAHGQNRTALWQVQAAKIGNAWNFREVFAGPQGAIYTISQNGDMHYYRHLGFNDGSNSWQVQHVLIGNGW